VIGLNTIWLALRAIRRNLLRSMLTTLGVVIGVAAVVTMVTVGNGATRAVQAQISSLGSNLLTVRPGQRLGPGAGSSGAPAFKLADVQAVATQIGGVAAAAPEVRASTTAVVDNRNWATTVTGSSNDYFSIGNWKLAAGRLFEPQEEAAGAAVCVIGATVRRELFGSEDPLGRSVRLRRFGCTVIGVLQAKGQGSFGMDQDDTIVVPTATAQRRVTGSTRVNTLLVSLQPGSDATRVMKSLTQLLRERRKLGPAEADNFNVLDTQQIAQTLSGTTALMLVSVTERTREIGLRLAVGAFEREVLAQFLVEAVVLAALGGLIGLLLALAASIGLSTLLNLPFEFMPGINALAFAFSAAIGIVFGFMPARRAARLDPIEALRHE
jgi:putative ABC transport system permease protein